MATLSSTDPANQPSPPDAVRASRPRLRLEALDGIRGFAALYVVYFHIGTVLRPIFVTLSTPWRLLYRSTEHGHDCVVTFIVLSGFVLMLPVARSANGQLPGGLLDYFRRRAKRILPAYYAALLIIMSLGVLWSLFVARHIALSPTVESNNPFVSDFSAGGILSHLFLLHNFTRPWSLAVDSPMWSVAVESQIYILFPLILLPVWRRFGMFAAVFSGFLVGLLPVLLLPHGTNFDTSCPWFVGIFAVGTAAACLAVSQKSDGLFSRPRAWAVTAILLFAAVILVQTRVPRLWNRLDLWHKDLLNALCVGALLVFLARSQLHPGARQSLLARVLSSKAFVTLGAFSYSLYLIHRPIIDLLEMMLPAHLQPKVHILALFALGLPTCLVTAYLFYLPFERNGLLGNYVISLATARRERRPVSPKSNSAQKAMMPLNGALGIEDETPATTGR